MKKTLEKTKTSRKYKINCSFFKEWSSDMAYVFGFWLADGWIYQKDNANEFCISQMEARKYILSDILLKMQSTHPIRTTKKNICSFKIQSKEICEDIKILGGKQHKSLDVLFPKIPVQYLADFVRGYFDGDGCVCKSKDKRRSKKGHTKLNYRISFTSGSRLFIDGLLEALRLNISGFVGNIQKKKAKEKVVDGVLWRNTSYIYVLHGGINDARRLKKYMYPSNNIMMLKEKYEKFNGIGEIKSEYLKADFMPYLSAKKIACSMGFINQLEWKVYAKENAHLPTNPQKVYKNSWNGWADFLGH